jgi:holo-[acyl-carrier protein] synthase
VVGIGGRAAVGIDIVSVGRIAALVAARGKAFTERWFTPAEIAWCDARSNPGKHFAARFAAKEAVVKTIPEGWVGPLPYHDVEILPVTGGSRESAEVRLHGRVETLADRARIVAILVSLSHCDSHATAIAWATFR